jgi:hypothetical protein
MSETGSGLEVDKAFPSFVFCPKIFQVCTAKGFNLLIAISMFQFYLITKYFQNSANLDGRLALASICNLNDRKGGWDFCRCSNRRINFVRMERCIQVIFPLGNLYKHVSFNMHRFSSSSRSLSCSESQTQVLHPERIRVALSLKKKKGESFICSENFETFNTCRCGSQNL